MDIYTIIGLVIGALVSLFGFGTYQRSVGRKQEQDRQVKEKLEDVRETKKTEDAVAGKSDDDILAEFDRLYNKGRK